MHYFQLALNDMLNDAVLIRAGGSRWEQVRAGGRRTLGGIKSPCFVVSIIFILQTASINISGFYICMFNVL